MSFKVVPMKSKHWLLVSFFNMLFLNVTFSQITFQKTYNGAIESKGNAVIQTSDEGYIVVGSSTQAFGLTYEDAYIIKTDKQGNVEWTTFYGGPLDEVAYSVRETDDGGFIIAANTSSYGAGYWDIYLIKVDKNGNSEWTKTIGGNNDDRCYAIEQTIDGGFIIAGTTLSFGTEYYNIYLIKTDRNGNEVWAKIFGGSGGDYAYAVQETEDGGFIICGDSQSFSAGGYTDVYLIKTDNSGNLLWSKTYGGPSNEGGKAISQTTDGGYIIAGITQGFSAYPKSDVYLIKTDESGNIIWTKTHGGASYDNATSIEQTNDGGYIIAGNTNRAVDGVFNCYLIKTDEVGDVIWTNSFGFIEYSYGDYFAHQTIDGGFIISGTTYNYDSFNNAVYLVKTDALGNTGCNGENISTVSDTPETQEYNTLGLDSNIISITSSPVDIYKNGTDTSSTICFNEIETDNSLWVYPNPCINEVIVAGTANDGEFIIYNIAGQAVLRKETVAAQTILNTTQLIQGIYLLNYRNGDKTMSIKLIKY